MSTVTKSVRQTVLERDGYACVVCGKQAVLYSIHPRKPLQIGRFGAQAWDNRATTRRPPGTAPTVSLPGASPTDKESTDD